MSELNREKLIKLAIATIIENKWIPIEPTPKQMEFLLNFDEEVLYGGAAGGGKSTALLAAALQFVDIPNYSALILRRTFTDLSLPGALMDKSHEWLQGKAKWNTDKKTWTFPSGATLTFGYIESNNDMYRYQSAEFQFIGFDELTQFQEHQYLYMFSRLRRLKGYDVPLRMRAATNPGGIGHEWVKRRFFVEKRGTFIRATLDDNPYLDRDEYVKALMNLDPITREQLLNGNWEINPEGGKFKREWFDIIYDYPARSRKVRYWDLSMYSSKSSKHHPDYAVGVLVAERNGIYYVVDVKRAQGTPQEIERLVRNTAEQDGLEVEIVIEQEPGSSGVITLDYYRRHVLRGFAVRGYKSNTKKEARINIASAAAEAGNIKLVAGPWIADFLDELVAYPYVSHDDQVDALSGAIINLGKKELPAVPKPKGW